MTDHALAVSGSSAPGAAQKPAQRTTGVAVLGTGSAGMRHLEALEALRQLLQVEPIAVPRRPVRATELAGRYTVATYLEEALARGAAAAIIATDTGRHLEDGLAALACGLDVLIEKPLASGAADAARLRDAAAQQGKKLFVGCLLRFSESLGRFRGWLPAIGQVHSVRVECQSYLPDWRPQRPYQQSYSARGEEGGVLRDLIHEIDYAGWIFGWPTALQAMLSNTGALRIKAEEAAELSWETAHGCVVSVRVDYLTRPTHRTLRAYGQHGMIEWEGVQGRVTLTRVGKPPRDTQASQTRDDMFLAQAKAFVGAIRGTMDARLATGADGIRALAVCDAARRAAATRREEPVVYP